MNEATAINAIRDSHPFGTATDWKPWLSKYKGSFRRTPNIVAGCQLHAFTSIDKLIVQAVSSERP